MVGWQPPAAVQLWGLPSNLTRGWWAAACQLAAALPQPRQRPAVQQPSRAQFSQWDRTGPRAVVRLRAHRAPPSPPAQQPPARPSSAAP